MERREREVHGRLMLKLLVTNRLYRIDEGEMSETSR